MFRNFRFHIVIRLLLILVLGYVAVYVATQTHFWLVAFWIGLLVVILTIELIRYVERSNKDLYNFLLAIRQSDFSTIYPTFDNKGSSDRLKEAYTEILQVFHQLRSEKEFHHQYLQLVVEHIKVALLCYDEREEIILMNDGAKKLLSKPYLKNIQALLQIDNTLPNLIRQLEAGQRELLKVEINGVSLHLSIQATAFKMQQKHYKLISFQDIRNELEAQEVESWQKLIRVLTHEIMNSVIPIATLTSVINGMLVENDGQSRNLATLDEEDASDIRNSLQTIENRSKGLLNFVKAYSSLTRPIKPVFGEVSLKELFSRVHTLLKPTLDKKVINFEVNLPSLHLRLLADLELIEQVLINLLLNAADAVEGKPTPRIQLTANKTSDNTIVIQVKDNGTGIEEQILENIFVPFFSTKPKGSGIGLSLSRQIMLLHKGNITVQSNIEEGTTFTLLFPAEAGSS